MNMATFDPDQLLEIARKNLPFILENEMENGVPLNYIDDQGRYVFRYKDGTVLPASLDISFRENWENHRRIIDRARAGGAEIPD